MSKMTGNAESDVIAEIERYIVMPGQACAYKVGMMEMMSIRADAEKRLGERFDIKAFHDVVLRNGAMPLAILRRVVDDWVKMLRLRADDRCRSIFSPLALSNLHSRRRMVRLVNRSWFVRDMPVEAFTFNAWHIQSMRLKDSMSSRMSGFSFTFIGMLRSNDSQNP